METWCEGSLVHQFSPVSYLRPLSLHVRLYHLPLSRSLETVTVKDPPDVLDRQKCLDALAALRHAKWFQVCILIV